MFPQFKMFTVPMTSASPQSVCFCVHSAVVDDILGSLNCDFKKYRIVDSTGFKFILDVKDLR